MTNFFVFVEQVFPDNSDVPDFKQFQSQSGLGRILEGILQHVAGGVAVAFGNAAGATISSCRQSQRHDDDSEQGREGDTGHKV